MGNEEEDLQIISINFHIKGARRREQLIYIKRISKSISLHWTSASRESQHYWRSSALNAVKLHPTSFCLQVVTPMLSPPELPKGSEQTAREPQRLVTAEDLSGSCRVFLSDDEHSDATHMAWYFHTRDTSTSRKKLTPGRSSSAKIKTRVLLTNMKAHFIPQSDVNY